MAKKKKPSRTILRPYKTYLFRDKDPVVDIMRTIVQDSGDSYQTIRDNSGVSTGTLRNWFYGATRRPQFATVQAVARALGQSFEPTKRKG
jgi:hypothetical protein